MLQQQQIIQQEYQQIIQQEFQQILLKQWVIDERWNILNCSIVLLWLHQVNLLY